MFKLHDGIERRSRRFAAHTFPKAVADLANAIVSVKTLEMLWIEKASLAAPAVNT
jgi:hypothetical protein